MTDTISIEDYERLYKARSKYGNHRVVLDGKVFDSKAEYQRWLDLKVLVAAGQIHSLLFHPRYLLAEAFTDRSGKRERAIVYEGDFEYYEGQQRICEDVKGAQTAAFKLKWKLAKAKYQNVDFRIVSASR